MQLHTRENVKTKCDNKTSLCEDGRIQFQKLKGSSSLLDPLGNIAYMIISCFMYCAKKARIPKYYDRTSLRFFGEYRPFLMHILSFVDICNIWSKMDSVTILRTYRIAYILFLSWTCYKYDLVSCLEISKINILLEY